MFYSATSTVPVTELFKVPLKTKIKDQRGEFRRTVRNYFDKRNVLDLNIGISASYNVATKSITMPSFLRFAFGYTLIENWIYHTFVYIEIEALNISLQKLGDVMSRCVDAIIDVHTFGNHFDIGATFKIKEDYNALLIEDCAYASYSKYMEYPVGVLEVYSFFPIYKYFPAMEEEFHITDREEDGSVYENEKIEKKPFFRFIYIFNPLIFMINGIFGEKGIVRESSSYRKEPQIRCCPLYINTFNHFFIKIKDNTMRKSRVCEICYIYIKVIKLEILRNIACSRHCYHTIIKPSENISHIIKYLRKNGIIVSKFSYIPTIIFKKNGFPDALKAVMGIIMLSIYPHYSEERFYTCWRMKS